MARTKQTARMDIPNTPPRNSARGLVQRREKKKKKKEAAAQGHSSPYAFPHVGRLPSSGIAVATTTTPSHVHRYTPDALRKKYRDCYTDAAGAPMHPNCPFLYPDFLETRVADGGNGGSFGKRTYTKTTEEKDAPASADDIRRIIKHVISRLPRGEGGAAAATVTAEKVRKRLYDELYELKFGRKFVEMHGAAEDAYRLYDPRVAANIKKIVKKTSPIDETDRATVDCVGLLINAAVDVWNRTDASGRPPGFKQTKKERVSIPLFGLCSVGSSNAGVAFDRQKGMLEVFFKLYTPSACVDALRVLTYIEYQEKSGAASVIKQIMDRYGVPLHLRQTQQLQQQSHQSQQQSQQSQQQSRQQSRFQPQSQQSQQQRQQRQWQSLISHLNFLPALYTMLRALEGEYSSTGTRYSWNAICRALQNAHVGGTQQTQAQAKKSDAGLQQILVADDDDDDVPIIFADDDDDDGPIIFADDSSSDDRDSDPEPLTQRLGAEAKRGTKSKLVQARQAANHDDDGPIIFADDSSSDDEGFGPEKPKRRLGAEAKRGTMSKLSRAQHDDDSDSDSDSSDGFVQRSHEQRRGTGSRRPRVEAQAQQMQSQDQKTSEWYKKLKERPIVYRK